MKNVLIGILSLTSVCAFAQTVEVYQSNGMTITAYVIQVDSRTTVLNAPGFFIDGDKANFHSIKASRKQAELLCKELQFGILKDFMTYSETALPITFSQAKTKDFFQETWGPGLLGVTCEKR